MKWKVWFSVFSFLTILASWFIIIIVQLLSRDEVNYPEEKALIYLILTLIISSAYFNTIFTPPRKINECYSLNIPKRDEKMLLKEARKAAITLGFKEYNLCRICDIIKPPRTHHCKQCERCVMKMDHHCPMLQVCIHHHNHKFYLLLLFWPFLLGLFVSIIGFSFVFGLLCKIFASSDLNFTENCILTAYSNAIMIVFSLGYLMYNQLSIIIMNRTIIEDSALSDIQDEDMMTQFEVYDQGSISSNLSSIFGPSVLLSVLPVLNTPGDGTYYPSKLILGKDV